MTPESTIEAQLVDYLLKPLHIKNVELDMMLFYSGKERYRFTVGTTNAEGHLTIPYSLLESIRKENQEFALMDYNTKLEDCDSEALIRAANIDELNQRASNLARWFPDKAAKMVEHLKLLNNQDIEAAEARI